MLCLCSLHLCPILACASCKFRGSLEDRGLFLCLRPIFYRHWVCNLGTQRCWNWSQLSRGAGGVTLCTSCPVSQRVTERQSTGCGHTNSLELKLASCACLWTVEGSRKTWGDREHANSTPVHRPNMWSPVVLSTPDHTKPTAYNSCLLFYSFQKNARYLLLV